MEPSSISWSGVYVLSTLPVVIFLKVAGCLYIVYVACRPTNLLKPSSISWPDVYILFTLLVYRPICWSHLHEVGRMFCLLFTLPAGRPICGNWSWPDVLFIVYIACRPTYMWELKLAGCFVYCLHCLQADLYVGTEVSRMFCLLFTLPAGRPICGNWSWPDVLFIVYIACRPTYMWELKLAGCFVYCLHCLQADLYVGTEVGRMSAYCLQDDLFAGTIFLSWSDVCISFTLFAGRPTCWSHLL